MAANAERVLRGLRRVVADAEALLAQGGDRLELPEREALFHARHAARRVDRYAHVHPWQVAGLGVALAAAAVLAACLAIDSRRG